MPKITVHHLEKSRSTRVLWALEELDLDYEIVEYKRNPKTMRAPPELRRVHPLGKSPVVDVDGMVLAESGAVLEYLVERFGEGRLRPTDPELAQRCRYWLHYAEGSLLPPLLVRLIEGQIRKAPVPFFIRPITRGIASQVEKSYSGPEITNHLRFIEEALGEHEWFAGPERSIADIQMSYPLQAATSRGGIGEHPRIARWIERVEALPAYQRAIERGGVMASPA